VGVDVAKAVGLFVGEEVIEPVNVQVALIEGIGNNWGALGRLMGFRQAKGKRTAKKPRPKKTIQILFFILKRLFRRLVHPLDGKRPFYFKKMRGFAWPKKPLFERQSGRNQYQLGG